MMNDCCNIFIDCGRGKIVCYRERKLKNTICQKKSQLRNKKRKISEFKKRINYFICGFVVQLIIFLDLRCAAADGYVNNPPKFLIDNQTEIVLRLKEGNETPVGSLIYTVNGCDQDGDTLTFGIKETIGNELIKIEHVEKNAANLILKKELDREAREEYGLILTLTDGRLGDGNFITQSLLILVEDVNDNEPVFKQFQSTLVLPENSPPGIVLTVEATDRDEGTYGQVIYRLKDLDGDDSTFSISTINGKGVIKLIKELDYEEKILYQLQILAMDRSNTEPVNTGTSTVVIKVEDVEDRLPEFVAVSPVGRITEDAEVGTEVMRVKAIDGDRGINNSIVYSITKGSEGDFEIDSTYGIVYTAKKLDRESSSNNGAYILEITAHENSKIIFPPPFTKTEVTIIVSDVNDETPTFRNDSYKAEIDENAQINTPVTFFDGFFPEIYDHDQGKNGTFRVFIEGDRGIFEVTPSVIVNEGTFLIRVKNPERLDYEKVTIFNFTIFAKEIAEVNPKNGSVPVTIFVRDVNDNIPQFSKNLYRISVSENSKKGKIIASVRAVDTDSGNYGTTGIRYTGLGGSVAEYLTINSVTGDISVISQEPLFDREFIDRHYVTVEAVDNLGKGNRNTVQIIIDVEDVNDNAPRFLQTKYEARLQENHINFERPLIVEANDQDLNGTDNSKIRYRIKEGYEKDNFTIDPVLGLIQPKHHIDFEKLAFREKEYDAKNSVIPIRLLVVAQDHGTPSLSSSVFVTIYVTDMNDHAPTFDDMNYGVTVPETVPPGSSIFQLTATDRDSSSPNNEIVYKIKKGPKDKFVINPETGVIRIAPGASLDPDLTFPPTFEYSLTVIAEDGGIGVDQLHESVEVIIDVKDVNNKVPVFKEPGVIRIKENSESGKHIFNIEATDPDHDHNLKFTFDKNNSEARNEEGTIVKQGDVDFIDFFDLNPTNGTLKVKRQIDREKIEIIRLGIVCEDTGAIGETQKAFTTLTVLIEDENDNSPVFKKPLYRRSVTENSKNGTSVVNVIAEDPDKDKGIKYHIQGSDDVKNMISLDSETGEIVVANKIDHERTSWLNFSVGATDSGEPPRSSFVDVHVQILDENDNSPVFVSDFANLTITEDVKPGKEIIRIEAKDADSGEFGKITYLLDGISSQGKFKIDSTSGILSVVDFLDREKQNFYVLMIEAWDNYQFGYANGESRNAFQRIGITVSDVNDEIPTFEPLPPCTFVNEYHDVKDPIMIIKADDKDDPLTPNGKMKFSIVEGNDDDLFYVTDIDNGSAKISAARRLKGSHGNYTLTVEVKDLGHPQNVAKTQVSICVLDFNDNAPAFVYPTQNSTVKVFENATVESPLIKVTATDDDVGDNAVVRYKLRRDPLGDWKTFEIDEKNGTLFLKRPLDNEKQKVYHLRIEAYDLGIPTSLSSDLDLIVYVKNVNDFPPQFLINEMELNFTEHSFPGAERKVLVDTVDKDESDYDENDDDGEGVDERENKQVCYFLVGGNEKGLFFLDPYKHELIVQQELDREETEEHVLLVKATEDCLDPPSNVSSHDKNDQTILKVVVKVNDINDHAPKFLKKVFTGGVTTNADFGTELIKIKALDLDSGINGKVEYYLVNRTQSFLAEDKKIDRSEPFLIDKKTGSLFLNFYPQKDMKGYFKLTVMANDSQNLQDTACVFIYLLRQDQRVKFVLRQHPTELKEKLERFSDELKQITGATVNIDELKVHENKDGSADSTKTDLFLHFVDRKNNLVIDVQDVLNMIDRNIEKLDSLFKDYNVLDSQPAESQELKTESSSAYVPWFILALIIQGVIQIFMLSLCISQRSKYKRAIRAATATAFDSDQANIDSMTGHVPNTNIHSVEGSNPIWMKGYENNWYKEEEEEEEESTSQTSEKDSLDNNAVNVVKGKIVEDKGKEVNNINDKNINYVSLPNKIKREDKEKINTQAEKQSKNLYQSLNSMIDSSLMAKKKMETTEL